jgi:hypothetical protein
MRLPLSARRKLAEELLSEGGDTRLLRLQILLWVLARQGCGSSVVRAQHCLECSPKARAARCHVDRIDTVGLLVTGVVVQREPCTQACRARARPKVGESDGCIAR